MNLGFIGLGNMGNPMASNLIKAGHKLTVHDLRRESAVNLLEMGADWADTPRDAATGNEVVFTSLPGPREVDAVVLGEGGVLEGTVQGSIYVDLSTNSPNAIRNVHRICAEKGVAVLDAPVSGGVTGAAAGTLALMVGGDEAVFHRIRPALDAMGGHVAYCGAIGAGMIVKLCNNLVSMGNGVLLAEALTMGVKAGVELSVLADVLSNGSGASYRLASSFCNTLFTDNHEPGFALGLAAKDVRLATDLGRELGVPMDLSNLVDQRHVEAMFRGWGGLDSVVVAYLQEERAGVQLRIPGM